MTKQIKANIRNSEEDLWSVTDKYQKLQNPNSNCDGTVV